MVYTALQVVKFTRVNKICMHTGCGGIGGLVVANRPSEKESSCIVLETQKLALLACCPRHGDHNYDSNFMTEPQMHVQRQIPHPRGKALGTSSAMNFRPNVYPSTTNFEACKELGNNGWDADGHILA